MPGRKAKIPEDMLPFKERLSPEETKRWVAEWRRLVWHSPRYVAIYAAVVIGAVTFFVWFMPAWEIVDPIWTKIIFSAGELFVVYVLAEFAAYGFSWPVIEQRMKRTVATDQNASHQS